MTFDFIDRLFPRQCIACGQQGGYLCKNCKRQLHPHPEICPYCHRTSQDYRTCRGCRREEKNRLEGLIILFAYEKELKSLIIKLKYLHKKDIAQFLAERMVLAIQANESLQKEFHNSEFGIINSKLIISFVPSHRYRRYIIKGYNQSEILAKRVSELLHIPIITLARKTKHTKSQAGLTRNERSKNLQDAYTLKDNLPLQGNETLVIIDDITTTGSTINELAKSVKAHYPEIEIRGAVLGRHM